MPETSIDRSRWETRADGSAKGDGFLGVMPRADGKVSSEISIGVTGPAGKEIEIPTMVPTLTKPEVQWLLTNDVSDPRTLPASIIQKAVAFAKQRIANRQPVFAQQGEQFYHIYPDIPRVNVPTRGFNDAAIRPVSSHGPSTTLGNLGSLLGMKPR